MSFTKKIIVSMILGILIGVAFNLTSLIESTSGTYIINLFDLGGSNNLVKKNYKVINLMDFPGH